MPYNKYGRYEQTPEEAALNKKILALVKKYTPPGARTHFNDELQQGSYLIIRFVCGGRYSICGWECGKEVGHKGKCFTFNKQVEFTPDRGTKGRKNQ